MKELEIIQNAFSVICEGIGQEFESFYVRYFINIEIVDDEPVELGMFNTSSKDHTGGISYFEKSDFDLLFNLKEYFEDLRTLMALKHKDKSKWNEAIMTYEKGSAVKMEYKYPDN